MGDFFLLKVKDIIEICHGKLLCGDKDVFCDKFTKDTRKIEIGSTYIGIKGENFDGSSFYNEAFEKGANAVIIEDEYVKNNKIKLNDKPIIVVKDSIKALKELATYVRDNASSKFIGVTGSVGKTSTRDTIASVLKENYTIINDAYNASLDSMESSLEILSKSNGKRKVAVLGSMLELGNYSSSLHTKVGEVVVKNNIDLLITVGKDARYIKKGALLKGMKSENIVSFDHNDEVYSYLKNNIQTDDVILFKASNEMKLNEIIEKL